jgi:surfeit locus 1 family protein
MNVAAPLKPIFKPTLAGTLAVLAALPLFGSLGVWQLNRAQQKRDLIAQFAAGAQSSALLTASNITELPLLHTVSLSGRFESARQVLLDNIPASRQTGSLSKPGYRVLTPLWIDAQNVVLVDRGWTAMGATRAVLPNVNVDEAPRAVRGRLAELPRPAMRLGEPPPSTAWPRVLNYPTLNDLRALYGEQLWPRIVLLDPEANDGFKRDWSQRYSVEEFGPDKHIAYALQWFGFAATALGIYIVLGVRRARQNR